MYQQFDATTCLAIVSIDPKHIGHETRQGSVSMCYKFETCDELAMYALHAVSATFSSVSAFRCYQVPFWRPRAACAL